MPLSSESEKLQITISNKLVHSMLEDAQRLVDKQKKQNKKMAEALARALDYIEQQTCPHEETHRGGAIWEICSECGCKWADDRGGKPEFKWPAEYTEGRSLLAKIKPKKEENWLNQTPGLMSKPQDEQSNHKE